MIGGADIEGSKSNVAKNDWLPHKPVIPVIPVIQVGFYPFVLHEISLLIELTLGHLRYNLTDLPPQPNSQPDSVFDNDRLASGALILENDP